MTPRRQKLPDLYHVTALEKITKAELATKMAGLMTMLERIAHCPQCKAIARAIKEDKDLQIKLD